MSPSRGPENTPADLVAVLLGNPHLRTVLDIAPELNLPDWYVGAGLVCQTWWNHAHGFDPAHGVGDVDLIYFDPEDTSWEAEDAALERARALLDDLPLRIDLQNQARVHLWYERRFGRAITPYRSAEDAVRSWPTTASAVALARRPAPRDATDLGGGIALYAPFGLRDLLGLVLRPNGRQIGRAVYEAKVAKWTRRRPELTVVPWNAT